MERIIFMYRVIQDFLDTWKYERISTIKVLRALTDASLQQKVSTPGRSLGFLAWHITTTLSEMGEKAGLSIDAPAEDSPVPAKASQIADAYDRASSSLESAVKTSWTDAMLLDQIEMYGQRWTRGATLTSLVTHQIHHRAQMTVLMRQAGLKVPGIYGPSREEWAQMGMPAQE
jgi:uncharacterized damage-inducible protein DinB